MPRAPKGSKKTTTRAATAGPIPFPATVLWTARYEYRPARSLTRHSHPFAQLIFVVHGRGQFHLREGLRPAAPFSCLLALPGESHGFTADVGQRVATLEAKFRLEPRLRRALAALPRIFRGDSGMHQLLSALRSEGARRRDFRRESCDLLLCEFLLRRLRLGKRGETAAGPAAADLVSGDRACEAALRYIEAHHVHPFRLGELAAASGLSYRQLSRRFLERLGHNPGAHVLARRMETAEELLRTGNLTCEAVARRSGFESVPHFSRVFKKARGLSPAAWRRREREGVRQDVILAEGFVDERRPDVLNR